LAFREIEGGITLRFFANQYQANDTGHGFPPSTNLSKIVGDAEGPALGEIAWAMVYPDFTRVVLPFSKWAPNRLIDRGWALEQTWRRRGQIEAMLGDWRAGINDGWRPTVFFNSTIVESGEPLLLSTNDLGQKTLSGVGRKSIDTFLPGCDVPVVTAVRLAASFPYGPNLHSTRASPGHSVNSNSIIPLWRYQSGRKAKGLVLHDHMSQKVGA
jgi:hypothetical protein